MSEKELDFDSKRQSVGRRVSFAATAHVRLFEKEDEIEIDKEEVELAKTLAHFHPKDQSSRSKYDRPRSLFDLSDDQDSLDLTGSPKILDSIEANSSTPISSKTRLLQTPLQSLFSGITTPKVTPRACQASALSSATPLLDAAISNSIKKHSNPGSFLLGTPKQYSSYNGSPSTPIHKNINMTSESLTPTKALLKDIRTVDESAKSGTFKANTKNNKTGNQESLDLAASIAEMFEKTPNHPSGSKHPTNFKAKDELNENLMSRLMSQTRNPMIAIAAEELKDVETDARKPRDSIAQFLNIFDDQTSNSISADDSMSFIQVPTNHILGGDSVAGFMDSINVDVDVDSDVSAIEPLDRFLSDLDPASILGGDEAIERRPRDSVAGFMDSINDDSRLDESEIKSRHDDQIVQLKRRPRDSVAVFLNNLDNTVDSINICSPVQKQIGTDVNPFAKNNKRSRDSVAVFLNNVVDSDDESILLNAVDIDSTLESLVLEERGPKIEIEDSFNLEAELLQIDRENGADDQRGDYDTGVPAKYRDSISPFFASLEDSFQEESILLDVSLDLTENKKFKGGFPLDGSLVSNRLLGSTGKNEDSLGSSLISGPVANSTPRTRSTGKNPLDVINLSPVDSPNSPARTKLIEPTMQITPRRSTRSLAGSPIKSGKKLKIDEIPRSNVTPMRRALANKAVSAARSATKAVTKVSELASISPSKASPKSKQKRKSFGGGMLQPLDLSKGDVIDGSCADPVPTPRSVVLHKKSKNNTKSDSILIDSQNRHDADAILMDETHLSFMDTSIIQEQSQFNFLSDLKISKLSDFLQATGVQFMKLGFKDQVLQPLIDFESMTTFDFVKAEIACCYSDTYRDGFKELDKKIELLRSSVHDYEKDIIDNIPLLFTEFSEGTDCDRDEIVANCKQSFLSCCYEAKSDWRAWKIGIIERSGLVLEQKMTLLYEDQSVISTMQDKYTALIDQSTNYVEELTENNRMIRQEYEDKSEELVQARLMLVAEKPLRESTISNLKAQIIEVERKSAIVDQSSANLRNKEVEHNCRIDQAEKLCANLIVFEPADLAIVRREYNMAVKTHGWRPNEISTQRQSWIFEDVLVLDFIKLNTIYKVSASIFKGESNQKGRKFGNLSIENEIIIEQIGESRLKNMLLQFENTNSKLTSTQEMIMCFRKLTMLWASIKSIGSDLVLANRWTSSPVEWDDGLHTIKTTFFSKAKQSHLVCILDFSHSEGTIYPYGTVDCSLKLTYGSIKYRMLISIDEIYIAVKEVENGPEYAGRCCQLIKNMLNL